MTRDQAVTILLDIHYPEHRERSLDPWCRQWGERTIEAFVRFGMLTLDEPKSASAKLVLELGWPENGRSHGELLTALGRAGLKIVEKGSAA